MKRKEFLKRLLCVCIATGMAFSMAACAGSSQNGTEATAPMTDATAQMTEATTSVKTQKPAAAASSGTTAITKEKAVENYMAAEEYAMEDEILRSSGMDSDVAAMEALTGVPEEGGLPEFNTEEYNPIQENRFNNVAINPFSTFAIDVDTGAYTNFRRMVNDNYSKNDFSNGMLRAEEMINYFDYEVKNVSDGKFSVQSEIHECPWNSDHELMLLTVQANQVEVKNEGNNFVYLIDTSGSMNRKDKLELAKKSFKLLTESLDPDDTVSIVTYAGNSDTLLEGCPARKSDKICEILDDLECNGGTNGSGGIEAAYKVAMKNFVKGGNNRVIIASDGDMNLGITSQAGLVDLIKEKKESGVFLTTLGFGSGNYSDANMEQIADAGNGNYYYIDCVDEARRVLVDKLKETTITVAKDVKIQVEFNPAEVKSYRLIGYENRIMSADDFRDDTVDGGEVGAGQQVTVLYELSNEDTGTAPESRYRNEDEKGESKHSGEVLNVAIRYKEVDMDSSREEQYAVKRGDEEISEDFYFAAGVADAVMALNKSGFNGKDDLEDAYRLAKKGTKENSYRQEFLRLIDEINY